MDYQQLLAKYIAHVGECEGIVFLTESKRNSSEIKFTEEEWDALKSAEFASLEIPQS